MVIEGHVLQKWTYWSASATLWGSRFCLVCAFNKYTFPCIPWSGDTCSSSGLESQYDTTWLKIGWSFLVCFADTVPSTLRSANRQAHIPTGRLFDGALHLEFDVSGSWGFNRDFIWFDISGFIHSYFRNVFFLFGKNQRKLESKAHFILDSKELPDCHDCVCLVQAFETGWWWECNAGWMRWSPLW